MFKGFNLTGFDEEFIQEEYRMNLIERGRAVTVGRNSVIQETLRTIASDKAVLNGAKIQESWFPQVNADVFLSHSHRNENLVLMLAGWLDRRFGLKAFVDSAIWNYAGDLLRIVDNAYCWQPESKTYNYRLRNDSTSQIHMMLTTALGMMIHRTECLIFVNTPESISTSDVVRDQTYSPWIYTELTLAGIVEEVQPARYEQKRIKAARSMHEQRELKILHTIQKIDRLKPISPNSLTVWNERCGNDVRGAASLDVLYEIAAEQGDG